jgi:hypothetical protein
VKPIEVCCINCKAIYAYVNTRLPEKSHLLFEDLPEPYDTMPDLKTVLTDENNWVSSAVVVKLFENAKKLLNDEDVAFKIGMESVINQHLGYIQRFFIATFSNVPGVYKRINQINSKFNNTKENIEIVHTAPGRLTTRLYWNRRAELSRDICRYNQGIYCAIPTIWRMEPAEIKEPSCFFQGQDYCEFDLTWNAKKSSLRALLDGMITRKSSLLAALEQIERDKALLKAKYDEVNHLNLELFDKVVKLEAINEASNVMISYRDTDNFLDMTMQILVKVLKFDRAILLLIDPQREKLVYRYSIGATPETTADIIGYSIPLSRDNNLMVKVVKMARPVLIKDVEKSGLNRTNKILETFHPFSFCLTPLFADTEIIGVLGADRTSFRQPITQTDLDYLSVFANNIAVSLLRSQLDDDLKLSYLSSVKALAVALEEKHPYWPFFSARR